MAYVPDLVCQLFPELSVYNNPRPRALKEPGIGNDLNKLLNFAKQRKFRNLGLKSVIFSFPLCL